MLQEEEEDFNNIGLNEDMTLRPHDPQSTITSLSQVIDGLTDIALGSGVNAKVLDYFTEIGLGNEQPLTQLHAYHIKCLKNNQGETFLIIAGKNGHLSICKQIIDESELEDVDSDGWTALLNAAQNGHSEVVKLLLEKAAEVDHADSAGWTPIMWAAYKNHPDTVQVLINYGTHVNVVDEDDGLTPLLVASARGYTEVVQLLVDAQANINACDKFGSTSLIWAARKGFTPIVEILLRAAADVDTIGMYGCTALMMATKGNYIHTLDALLTHEPNTNITDYNGVCALEMAAREGYAEICEALLQFGAYVNINDRFGGSVLTAAVRGGNISIVKMLLEKHADVNVKDSDGRTPMHLAVDKNYVDMVALLLSKNPNLEMKSRDGETALIRAAKSKNLTLVAMLVDAGAKISAVDNNGTNCLHYAIKAKSLQMVQILLSNPADSKLLYRPNTFGETPYSIDQDSKNPLLTQIYGAVDSEIHVNSMMGYSVYSDVLADILSEPNLHLPITVGFFAKWGTGKSMHLPKIKESMNSFSRTWLDGLELSWSWTMITFLAVLFAFITLPLVTITSLAKRIDLVYVAIAIGTGVLILTILVYFALYYGNETKGWSKSATTSRYFTKFIMQLKLVISIITLNVPFRSQKDHLISPVNFVFADDHRINSVGGEQTLATIITSLSEAIENHYGGLPVRLMTAVKNTVGKEKSNRLRKSFGIPVILLSIIGFIFYSFGNISLIYWILYTNDYQYESQSFVTAVVFFTMLALLICYPLYLAIFYIGFNDAKRNIHKIMKGMKNLTFERLLQKLQREVVKISNTVKALNAYTNSQTRLVIMIDGMENNEHGHSVKLLDALHLLFGAENNGQFITILAVDPHVIEIAAQNATQSSIVNKEMSGHDYIKSFVSMPFYLQTSAIRELNKTLQEKRKKGHNFEDYLSIRRDTFISSKQSIKDYDDSSKIRRGSTISSPQDLHGSSLAKFLLDDDYFATLGPTALRRIINSLSLTARLLRSFDINFDWTALGFFISLVEQWPYRMCWLMEKCVVTSNDSLLLYDLWSLIKDRLPLNQHLLTLDTTASQFGVVLKKSAQISQNKLTVGKVKKFMPCACNLDPFLRKVVSGERDEVGEDSLSKFNNSETMFKLTSQSLLKDPTIWNKIDKPLIQMKVDELIEYVSYLEIPQQRLNIIIEKFKDMNINGLVLITCSIDQLQQELKCNLGDWTLIKLLIETLRKINNDQILRTVTANAATQEAVNSFVDKAKKLIDEVPISASEERRKTNKLLAAHQHASMELVEEFGVSDFMMRKLSINPIHQAIQLQDLTELDKEKESTKSVLGSKDSDLKNLSTPEEMEGNDNLSTQEVYDETEQLLTDTEM